MSVAPSRLAQLAQRQLRPIWHESGQVLYSAVETLQPAPVYLLGHNPGGDRSNSRLMTVGQSVRGLTTWHCNSYLDTVWSGRETLQRRVIWLLAGLGFHPRSVPASNLVFVRSRQAADFHMRRYADLCWPIHEAILGIVRPKMVLVYGNSAASAYSYLREKAGHPREHTKGAGHGNWKCRTFAAPAYTVVGVPHLSRYDITRHENIVTWIGNLLRRA